MKRGSAIARRYARALFGLGERDHAEQLLAELETLVEEILAHPELPRVVLTPLHPRAERSGVVNALIQRLGLSAELGAFAGLLIEENRTALLPQIRDALREIVDKAAGRVEAQVISARPLDDDEAERLRETLSRRVGAVVSLKLEVDETLIGGVLARVGDLLLDGSVRTQLAALSGSLRRGSA